MTTDPRSSPLSPIFVAILTNADALHDPDTGKAFERARATQLVTVNANGVTTLEW